MIKTIKYSVLLLLSSFQYIVLIQSKILFSKAKIDIKKNLQFYDLVDLGFSSDLTLLFQLFYTSIIASFLLFPIAFTFINVPKKHKQVFVFNAVIAWIISIIFTFIYAGEVAWLFD